jgi:hypothetical protein
LRELSVAVSNIHSQFNAVIGAAMQAPVERGEFLLSELKAALSFLFDDGVDDEQDAELERLSAAFSDTSSHDALAQSLDGFSYYAAKLRERLAELPEFDPGFIDEAVVVARQLREQSAIKLSSDALDRQNSLLKLRNRLVTLLIERMRRARRAARFAIAIIRSWLAGPPAATSVGAAASACAPRLPRTPATGSNRRHRRAPNSRLSHSSTQVTAHAQRKVCAVAAFL